MLNNAIHSPEKNLLANDHSEQEPASSSAQDATTPLSNQMVSELRQTINNFARRNLWNVESVDDFEQDVFEALISKLSRSTQVRCWQSYCKGICRLLLIDYIHRETRYRTKFSSVDTLTDTVDYLICDLDFGAMIDKEQLHQRCLSALNLLRKERDRQLFIAHVSREDTTQYIAKNFSLNNIHVYRVLSRAKKRLRNNLTTIMDNK